MSLPLMISDDFETLPCRVSPDIAMSQKVCRGASHNGVLLQNVRINHLQQVIRRFLVIRNMV